MMGQAKATLNHLVIGAILGGLVGAILGVGWTAILLSVPPPVDAEQPHFSLALLDALTIVVKASAFLGLVGGLLGGAIYHWRRKMLPAILAGFCVYLGSVVLWHYLTGFFASLE